LPIGFTSGQIPAVPMNLPLLKNYSIESPVWEPDDLPPAP
jgi:hypothetical protein